MQKRKSAGQSASATAPANEAPASTRHPDHRRKRIQAVASGPSAQSGVLTRRAFLALALAGAFASQVPIAAGPRQVRFSNAAMAKALNRVIADNNAFAAGMRRSRAQYRGSSPEHLAEQIILAKCGYPRRLG